MAYRTTILIFLFLFVEFMPIVLQKVLDHLVLLKMMNCCVTM
uniref:Uncharacterized protein n=1 Tax=Rhizophora mucronata TaxID=61149 RepID=A0A2P2QMK1_RHIMU